MGLVLLTHFSFWNIGSFLTYRELDTKRRPRRNSAQSSSSPSTHGGAGGSIACSYKPHGLIKQSFSICTAYNQKMHLISYYSKADVAQGNLALPSMDPNLADVVIPKGLYPELNPLDTSGGHSATFHLMLKASIDEQQLQLGLHHTGNSNYSSRKRDTLMAYAQPPSLSSSPLSTCSEDDLLSPSHQTLTLLPHHHQQQQHQEQHHHQEHQRQQHQQQLRTTSITTSPPWPSPSATKQLTPASYHTSHHNHASLSPPAQAWKPYSLQSEDTRQLEALKTQLRIWFFLPITSSLPTLPSSIARTFSYT